MNNIYTSPMTATASSAQRTNYTTTASTGTAPSNQARFGSNPSSSITIADRIFRLTGKVHLAARSSQRWHLCGINE